MKKFVALVVFIGVISGFVTPTYDGYRTIKNSVFNPGEHIEYVAHYGPINAGTASVDVSKKLYYLNGRLCYRVDIFGKSVGAFDAITRIRDTWRSYIDTSAFMSHRFYRHIEETDYRRDELTHIEPAKNRATMRYEQWKQKRNGNKEKLEKGNKVVVVPRNAQDMISGYYYLRMLDFDAMKPDQIITIPGFLEDKIYNLQIKYKGKDIVKTKFGKIHAHKLVPIMPKNGLFSGEKSIRFWVSDDGNRVPVRIEADMFIGKVVVEIKNFSRLRHKFNFKKKK
jgi:hypothetical protein